MDGHREEYLSNKGCIHAMFVDCLENALDLPDLHPPSPLSPHLLPPSTLDDECIVPPVAIFCVPTFVPSFAVNTDVLFDLYAWCDPFLYPKFCLVLPSIDFGAMSLVLLMALYNALLDSGCTHHIICDCALFSNFVSKDIFIGTANCGSLEALGTGNVNFWYPYSD